MAAIPSKPTHHHVEAARAIATGVIFAYVLNEGKRDPMDALSGNPAPLTNGAAWVVDAGLGGQTLDLRAGASACLDLGENGLSYGNGDCSVFYVLRRAVGAVQRVAVELAGGATDGLFFGISDSGGMQCVLADVAQVDTGVGIFPSGDALSIGTAFERGVGITFNGWDHDDDTQLMEFVPELASPVASGGSHSVVGARRDQTNGLLERLALLLIWNRKLANAEFDALHADPWLVFPKRYLPVAA